MLANRVHIALLTAVATAVTFNPPDVRAQGCSSCQASQPAAGYYQPATVYQMSGTATPYYGGNACNTCAPAAQPVAVQPLYQPTVRRPIPRTSYRTEWIPNRITYYRPTMGVSPTTGAPAVSYRACQTQGQILQRVPTFGLFASPAPTYSHVPSGGCSTCTPTTTIAPSTTIPYTPPATLTPSPAPATTTVPGPARTTAPEGNVPAETRPSLKPEARTNAQGASVRGLQFQPSYSSGVDSSPPAMPSLDSPSRLRVEPVPDPDAPRAGDQPAGDAPLLLDPRHKTAARPNSAAPTYTQITWPGRQLAPNRIEAKSSAKPVIAPSRGATEWKTVDW